MRSPEDVAPFLAEDQLKLYRLIWMRFIASQMNPAVFDQTTIDVNVDRARAPSITPSAPPGR
jgi:DNA topoisomerase-1